MQDDRRASRPSGSGNCSNVAAARNQIIELHMVVKSSPGKAGVRASCCRSTNGRWGEKARDEKAAALRWKGRESFLRQVLSHIQITEAFSSIMDFKF